MLDVDDGGAALQICFRLRGRTDGLLEGRLGRPAEPSRQRVVGGAVGRPHRARDYRARITVPATETASRAPAIARSASSRV